MHKKEKNIINPANAANLTGGTEANLKAKSAGENADFKTGATSAGNILPGDKADKKTVGSYSALSGKLYFLILVGLSVAILLMLAEFGLDFFNGTRNLSLESLHENALNPAGLIDAIKNSQMPASLLISYAGLLTIIFVPAAGLIYIMGYFTYRKKYSLALAAAGVLFILILSAVIGLLKS
jgi:hypothetical protein